MDSQREIKIKVEEDVEYVIETAGIGAWPKWTSKYSVLLVNVHF